MATKQQDIRTLSEKHARLETLINHVNYETLMAEHRRQARNKAVGVDRVTKEEYDENDLFPRQTVRKDRLGYRPTKTSWYRE